MFTDATSAAASDGTGEAPSRRSDQSRRRSPPRGGGDGGGGSCARIRPAEYGYHRAVDRRYHARGIRLLGAPALRLAAAAGLADPTPEKRQRQKQQERAVVLA